MMETTETHVCIIGRSFSGHVSGSVRFDNY